MTLLLSMEDVDVDKMRQLLWEEDVAQIPSILIFFLLSLVFYAGITLRLDNFLQSAYNVFLAINVHLWPQL